MRKYLFFFGKKEKTLSVYSFMELIPSETEAVKFIEKKRWGENPVCPHYKSKETSLRVARKGHRYKKCRKDFTVRTGTIFENSRIDLHKWLYTMYLFVTSRKGVSSLQLSKEIGIKQKSAWFLLQRIREICSQDESLLEGFVEIGETYIGGKEKNKNAFKKAHRPSTGALFKCPICEKRGIIDVTFKIVLDHDKAEGKIRGYICDSCNTGLGRFKNGKNYLKNAMQYIEMFKDK